MTKISKKRKDALAKHDLTTARTLVEAAMKSVAGTARSMGITVSGTSPFAE